MHADGFARVENVVSICKAQKKNIESVHLWNQQNINHMWLNADKVQTETFSTYGKIIW